jgi:hypothetical protein
MSRRKQRVSADTHKEAKHDSEDVEISDTMEASSHNSHNIIFSGNQKS